LNHGVGREGDCGVVKGLRLKKNKLDLLIPRDLESGGAEDLKEKGLGGGKKRERKGGQVKLPCFGLKRSEGGEGKVTRARN